MYRNVVQRLDDMSTNIRYKAIFLYLLRTEEFVTSRQISEIMGVTERTIKSDIKDLRMELIEFNDVIRIESKPSKGYKLNIDSLDLKNRLKKHYRIYQPQMVDNEFDQRVNYILRRLLSLPYQEYITLEKIHDELYLGQANNVQRELQKVKNILSGYQLSLETRPHYGMRVEGSAIAHTMLTVRMYKYFDKRVKIDFNIEDYNSLFFVDDKEYKNIKKITLEKIRSSKIVLNDIYAERLLIYMLYLKNRDKSGWVKKLEHEISVLSLDVDFKKTEEFKFVNELNHKMSKEINQYELSNEKAIFLTMVTIMSTDLYRYIDCNITRYGKLIPMTEQIINHINEFLIYRTGLSIFADPTCYKDMTKLLIPISLKVYLKISDDVDFGFYNMDVREEKPILYQYVELMSEDFDHTHHYRFSTREKYLIFNVLKGMVDRIHLPSKPLKLAIIAINGRLSTQHLKFNLKHHYSEYIEKIDTRVLYDLEMEKQENLDYDYYLCMDYGKNMNISFNPIYYADESLAESDYVESLSQIFTKSYEYERYLPKLKLVKLDKENRLKSLEIDNISQNPQRYDHFVLDKNNQVHLYLTNETDEFFDIYMYDDPQSYSLEGIKYILKIGINPEKNSYKIKIIFEIIDKISNNPELLDDFFMKDQVSYEDFYNYLER